MLRKSTPETSTQHMLMRAQNDDPGCVTIPNLCHGSLVQTSDGCNVRCFSVAVRTPNYIPDDKWMLVKLVSPIPETDENIDTEHIYVDHITCGILQDNKLQVVIGDQGRLDAIKMYPADDAGDPQKYWENLALQLSEAKSEKLEYNSE